MKHCVQLIRPGQVSYAEGLRLQQAARLTVEGGSVAGALLLLEHDPVITVGRGGGRENLILPSQDLEKMGIAVAETDRGGNITCHGPGQLVGYPVLNLSCWQEDVHWYVEQLEEVLIRSLRRVGLAAGRKAKYTGVWIGNQKIAAIGVSVRHWITGHGFALNVDNDLSLFGRIIPCGIQEFGVTSLQALGLQVEKAFMARLLVESFSEIFTADIKRIPQD